MNSIPSQEQTVNTPPIDRVLALLPDAKGPNGADWYQAYCPAHHDKNCSLSFKEMSDETSAGVAFVCFADCERPAILASLGLTEEELRRDLDKKRVKFKTEKPLELIDLAVDKLIHPHFLLSLGVIEGSCTFHTKEG